MALLGSQPFLKIRKNIKISLIFDIKLKLIYVIDYDIIRQSVQVSVLTVCGFYISLNILCFKLISFFVLKSNIEYKKKDAHDHNSLRWVCVDISDLIIL